MDQVPHAMAKSHAALLEMGIDAPRGCLGVCPESRPVAPLVRGIDDFKHVLGVLGPVGREVQQSARPHARGEEFDELRLDQASLVMTLLGPRIREIDGC